MKKTIKLHAIPIFIATILMFSVIPTFASDIPREAVPDNTPQAAVDIAESYISDTLTKVQSGMGYADAKGETNRILFKAYLANQTGGYSYGLLKIIANNAIFEYPVNAMTRICKKLSMPKKAAMGAIQMFEMSYGGGPATAHDVFMAMQEIMFLLKTENTPESKLLFIEENLARTLSLDWNEYDLARTVSY